TSGDRPRGRQPPPVPAQSGRIRLPARVHRSLLDHGIGRIQEESGGRIMTTTTMDSLEVPVRKSITVKASPERAFAVFTEQIDTWWPRSHHIGKSPMKKILIEGHPGGRCYTEQVDGTDCPWGQVLVWEP